MEPFILSAHRQLSAMHQTYKLLDPHMRYTLEINAIARQNLLNADGVIEQGFTPGRYCAAAYKHWRFDLEGLPVDLIRRGMAVPGPTLNFGHYPYGGYIPNRPPRMRRLIPDENDPEYASFLEDTAKIISLALPRKYVTVDKKYVVDTLSTHSPDEEYIGERQQRDTWSGDAEMVEAFYRFASEIQRIEKEIEKRNRDMSVKNRCGAGVLPYELLAPKASRGKALLYDTISIKEVLAGNGVNL
ncbi:linoleate 13S-lipoxygenase 3-1, chloroplastic [Tanacetum coccineum]